VTTNKSDGYDWIALLPVTLSDVEKQCLEVIASFGAYAKPKMSFGSYFYKYLDELSSLQERKLLWSRRDDGAPVYGLTETGKLWLRRRTENTGEHILPDEVTALFNSFDEATQWGFAKFAAMRLGMELHPEAEESEEEG
jgi:hypothetical protein